MYIRTSPIAVVLDNIHKALETSAIPEFGGAVGALELIPILKPVGHQSTKLMLRRALMVAIAAEQSFGTTSPRYNKQHDMYFPVKLIWMNEWMNE